MTLLTGVDLGPATVALHGEVPPAVAARLAPLPVGLPAALSLDVRRQTTPPAVEGAAVDVLGIWHRSVQGPCVRYDVFVREWSTQRPALCARVEGGQGRLAIDPLAPEEATSALAVDALLQLLCVEALASVRGLLVHASAVERGGAITLFAGNSGMGKSTAAGHCSQHGARKVCEDRTALWLTEEGAWAIPTPFQAGGRAGSVKRPLRAVHLLVRAEAPRLEPLSLSRASQQLLACSFAPFWDAALLLASLTTAAELCSRVPVDRLHLRDDADFVPLALGGPHATA